MADLEKLGEEASGLTILEARELAKLLEEKWDASNAAAATALSRVSGKLSENEPNLENSKEIENFGIVISCKNEDIQAINSVLNRFSFSSTSLFKSTDENFYSLVVENLAIDRIFKIMQELKPIEVSTVIFASGDKISQDLSNSDLTVVANWLSLKKEANYISRSLMRTKSYIESAMKDASV